MNPLKLIQKYYEKDSDLYHLLVDHGQKVAEKSLEIARNMPHTDLDFKFIENAAMLHDIGIIKTRSQSIGCQGDLPYICHGYLGRQMLDAAGLDPAYGLVAERHTGAGITKDNIQRANLPLPERDMVPLTLEEQIICCADKYYSKSPESQGQAMTRDKIIAQLEKISPDHARRFTGWAREFNLK